MTLIAFLISLIFQMKISVYFADLFFSKFKICKKKLGWALTVWVGRVICDHT